MEYKCCPWLEMPYYLTFFSPNWTDIEHERRGLWQRLATWFLQIHFWAVESSRSIWSELKPERIEYESGAREDAGLSLGVQIVLRAEITISKGFYAQISIKLAESGQSSPFSVLRPATLRQTGGLSLLFEGTALNCGLKSLRWIHVTLSQRCSFTRENVYRFSKS